MGEYRLVSTLLLLTTVIGCGDSDSVPDAAPPDGPAATPTARFRPSTAPMPFGDVPYPNDLYLSASGGVQLGQLPVPSDVSPVNIMVMNDALAEDHGFGQTTALFFAVDAAPALDAAALQQNVHLVDLTDGRSLSLYVTFDAAKGRICAQPLFPLKGGHKYGAWIDRALGLASTPDFDAAKAQAPPSNPAQARAHTLLAPLWMAPANVPRDSAAVATVFTTHLLGDALARAKQHTDTLAPVARSVVLIQGTAGLDQALGEPATALPGVDNPGVRTPNGLVHSHIKYIVHGIFDAPSYLTATADSGFNGTFAFDGSGQPMVKGQQPLYFTLVLPDRGGLPFDASNPVPVVLFVPGLSQERHYAYAIADGLAERGIATLAIDLLFHGDRNRSRRDFVNNSTHAGVPDGLGDDQGQLPALQYLAAGAIGPGVHVYDGRLTRDDLRQSVIDWWVLARFAKAGDFTAIRAADTALVDLTLRGDRLAAVAVKMAMPPLLVAASYDSSFTAVAGSQPAGGSLYPFMMFSPVYAVQFIPIFGSVFNIVAEYSANPERHPIVTLYQQVVEPGDPAALLAGTPKQHTFFLQPLTDEEAASQTEELMEAVLGIPALDGGTFRYQQLQMGTLPAAGNVTGPNGPLTLGVVQYSPATWDLFLRQTQYQQYMPGFPPFMKYPEPGMVVTNPIVQAQRQLLEFIISHFQSSNGVPTIPIRM